MERLRKYTTIFYSTHILDDVQRVSDTVTILNHGELVAHGSIEELLAGSGGPVYSITLKGNITDALERARVQEWVSEIQTIAQNDETTCIISVTDEAIAEAQLLRLLLADENLIVTNFRRKQYELEEIFVNIVEGDQDG